MRDDSGRVTGVIANTPTGLHAWRASLVVGADGLHSEVAKRVGANITFAGAATAATLYSYWQGLTAAGYEWHFGSRSSVGAIPTNDGAVCVFVSLPAGELSALVRPNVTTGYERILRVRFPAFARRLEGARRLERVRGFGGHRGFMKRAAGPGWALVGDAGYFKDPITAHGITDALRDAELLARAIVAGTADAFVDYAATRHDLSRRLFHVTDRIASFDWTVDELQALHREFSREMSREQRALVELEPLAWVSPSASAPVGA
jgi:2-polyprenyl-6-methoxyphenol hydroxylase-like FAD-dependent oxidoreductase